MHLCSHITAYYPPKILIDYTHGIYLLSLLELVVSILIFKLKKKSLI